MTATKSIKAGERTHRFAWKTDKSVQFKATKEEFLLIGKIARRAVALGMQLGTNYDLLDANMDIEAAHCNGCPLRLAALLAADDGNFGHDVYGIRRHINRRTGELENFFVPRFAK